MARKTTQIYLRRPKNEVEHAPSSLRMYGMDGQKTNCCTELANFCGCTKCVLCYFLIVSTILVMAFIVLLCLWIFLEPPLPAWSLGLFFSAPLGVLIDLIAFSTLIYDVFGYCGEREKTEISERRECLACGCKSLCAIVLWLIGWGLSALGPYLANRFSLGQALGIGVVLNLGYSLVAALFIIGSFCSLLCECK